MHSLTFALLIAIVTVLANGCITVVKTPAGTTTALFPSPPAGVDVVVLCTTCHHSPCRHYEICEEPWRWTCEVCGRQWGQQAESWIDGGRKVCRWCHYERWKRDREHLKCSMCNEVVWANDMVENKYRGYKTCVLCAVGDYCSTDCRLSHQTHNYRPNSWYGLQGNLPPYPPKYPPRPEKPRRR